MLIDKMSALRTVRTFAREAGALLVRFRPEFFA
jgi:hypothetical protein